MTWYGTEFISLSTFTSNVAPHLDSVNWLMVGTMKNVIVSDYNFSAALAGVIADDATSLVGLTVAGGTLSTTDVVEHSFHLTGTTVVDATHIVKVFGNADGAPIRMVIKWVDANNQLFMQWQGGTGGNAYFYSNVAGVSTSLGSLPCPAATAPRWVVFRQVGSTAICEVWAVDPRLGAGGKEQSLTVTVPATFGAGIAGSPGLRLVTAVAGSAALDDWTVATTAPVAYQARGNF